MLADLTRRIARAEIDLDLVYVATRNGVVFGAHDVEALRAALDPHRRLVRLGGWHSRFCEELSLTLWPRCRLSPSCFDWTGRPVADRVGRSVSAQDQASSVCVRTIPFFLTTALCACLGDIPLPGNQRGAHGRVSTPSPTLSWTDWIALVSDPASVSCRRRRGSTEARAGCRRRGRTRGSRCRCRSAASMGESGRSARRGAPRRRSRSSGRRPPRAGWR